MDEARQVARSLLNELESPGCPVDPALMRAKRLARLMRDADAQLWLDLETRGYPPSFDFAQLGTCRKYALAAGRMNEQTSEYYSQSLPALEAITQTDEALLSSLQPAKGAAASAKNFVEKNATEALLKTQLNVQVALKKAYVETRGLFVSIKSSLHHYAMDTYLAIELGDIAESVFEDARKDVDSFIRAHCPKAAEQIIAVNERMADGSPESYAAALTSCRRLLMTVADAVFPARAEDWRDPSGTSRRVGPEHYKNRLLAFISESNGSRGSASLVESELEHLASRVDAVYDKACKGVHADVSPQEARLAVIHTYLLLGEVAKNARH
jgi:hypothetical protein